jgi:hypothetical protein
MTQLGLRIGALGVLLLGGCPSDDSSEGDGTESETTATSGDGDGDATTGECTPPPGVFGDCIDSLDACMTSGSKLCIFGPEDSAVCANRCTDACDCWAAPASGDAPVACKQIDMSGDNTCVLDCSGGQTCPDGMVCLGEAGNELCLFQ